nr:sulfatase-like hydrolase/transferase [Bacteroidota bacterium]
MRSGAAHVLVLLKKLGGLLLLYTVCRLLFYFFHYSYFSDLSFSELLIILFSGLRFDLSVIILSNALFILLFLLPFPFREKTGYRILLKWVYLVVNSIALLANCIDLVYFNFTFKRTTADVFNFFGGKIGHDTMDLLPVFLKDYWYIGVIWIGLCLLLWQLYKRSDQNKPIKWTLKEYGFQILTLSIIAALSIIGYRGGLQLKPISTLDAGQYARSKNIPLVVSTPFTILKTLDLQAIEPQIFFENEDELRQIYDPNHPAQTGGMKKLNVILIALESFGKEYVGALNNRKEGYTPFLDSLITHSLCFSNAFSNGKKSIEGIPAITAALPTWMNEPFITSPYSGNRISSLAGILKSQGYSTSFFHGGTNGTMGFDAFASLAGYEKYYGRTEYNNDKD